jgi:integrase/recombinase XerC
LSRDAVERRVTIHAAAATQQCVSLKDKQLYPHVLLHSYAMSLLQAGVDSTVIALWLGHADVRSTTPYIHADMTIKDRALALVTPSSVTPGRYKPPDTVLAFLASLG